MNLLYSKLVYVNHDDLLYLLLNFLENDGNASIADE